MQRTRRYPISFLQLGSGNVHHVMFYCLSLIFILYKVAQCDWDKCTSVTHCNYVVVLCLTQLSRCTLPCSELLVEHMTKIMLQ